MDKSSRLDNIILYSFCASAFFAPASVSACQIFLVSGLIISLVSGRMYEGARAMLGISCTIPVAIIILMHLIGLLYTPELSLGLGEAKKMYYWLGMLATAALVVRGADVEKIALSFIAGVTAFCSVYIFQYLGAMPLYGDSGRLGFIHHITYSFFINISLLSLSYLFRIYEDSKRRAIIVAASLLLFVTLLIVESRTGYVLLAVSLPFILYNYFSRKFLLIAIASVLVMAALFTSPVVQNRLSEARQDIEQMRQNNYATSLGQRIYMWEGSLKIIQNRPFTGAGTGGYRTALNQYHPISSVDYRIFTAPHNYYFYMGVSFGVAGVAVFIWLLYCLASKGWRSRNTLGGAFLFSFTYLIAFANLFDTQIRQSQSGILFAIAAGMTAIAIYPSANAGQAKTSL